MPLNYFTNFLYFKRNTHMKNYIYTKHFIILLFSILIFGCNAESYVEGEGFLTETESNVDNSKGSLTIYSNSSFACSNGLVIYADGVEKGTLKEQRLSGTPNCGEKSSTAVTLILSTGSHKIEIKGSGSVFCPKYSPTYVTVEKGRCSLLQLGS